MGWGLCSQRAAKVAPRANAKVPPHSWGISYIPRVKPPSYLYNSINPGTNIQIPLVDAAAQVEQMPTQLPGC